MNMDTYTAIMTHRDQFIGDPHGSDAMYIALFADNKDTIDAIVTIARNAGHKVTKRIIGKGTPDAECHLRIN